MLATLTVRLVWVMTMNCIKLQEVLNDAGEAGRVCFIEPRRPASSRMQKGEGLLLNAW